MNVVRWQRFVNCIDVGNFDLLHEIRFHPLANKGAGLFIVVISSFVLSSAGAMFPVWLTNQINNPKLGSKIPKATSIWKGISIDVVLLFVDIRKRRESSEPKRIDSSSEIRDWTIIGLLVVI